MTTNLEERARELVKQLDHDVIRLTNKCTCGRPYITAIKDTPTDERLIAALLTQVQAEARLAALEEAAKLAIAVFSDTMDIAGRSAAATIAKRMRLAAQAAAPANGDK